MSAEVVDSPPEDWLSEAIGAWEGGAYDAATASATIAIAPVAIQGAAHAQTAPMDMRTYSGPTGGRL